MVRMQRAGRDEQNEYYSQGSCRAGARLHLLDRVGSGLRARTLGKCSPKKTSRVVAYIARTDGKTPSHRIPVKAKGVDTQAGEDHHGASGRAVTERSERV